MDPRHPQPTTDLYSVPGQRHTLALPGGHSAVLYLLSRQTFASPADSSAPGATPLVVVHSVNAAASAFEMEPVIVRQARQRPVVALELPGFGAAAKPDAPYSPQLMQQAVAAAIEWTQQQVAAGPVDVMALSLACEFATEAVLDKPGAVRTLTLISPTGMEGRRIGETYRPGKTREMGWLRRLLRNTRVGAGLYRLLTSETSMRFFLARSAGTRYFDPRLLEHGQRVAALPGARFAPLDFVAGALFTPGIIQRYRAVPVPMWVAHGTKGAFTDFGSCPESSGSAAAGGTHRVVRSSFETGALPHFQLPDVFDAAYERFLRGQQLPASAARRNASRPTYNPLKTELRHER